MQAIKSEEGRYSRCTIFKCSNKATHINKNGSFICPKHAIVEIYYDIDALNHLMYQIVLNHMNVEDVESKNEHV